jgi:hypothetical protein
MAPAIRRQNTRVAGAFRFDYDVLDFVARFRQSGTVPLQLVAEYARNTAVDDNNEGIWLAVVLGSLQNIGRLDYTYASIDKDATLAAYSADDFFWETGWKGHRAEVGVKLVDGLSAHGVGHWVRFKDSPRPEEVDHLWQRYRVELRYRY